VAGAGACGALAGLSESGEVLRKSHAGHPRGASVGIPAKLNAFPGWKPNGIPG